MKPRYGYRALVPVLLLLAALSLRAAPLPYTMSETFGTPTDMSDATSYGFSTWADDQSTGVMNIGFTFTFNGVDYTQYSVSTNGLIGFGSTAVSPNFVNSTFPDNGYPSVWNATYPYVAPFYDDLQISNQSGSDIRGKIVGTEPHRVLVVEWTEMFWARDPNVIYTFQARLYEGSGRIEYLYIQVPTAQSTSATIGMVADVSNYLSVTPGSPATVSGASANNGINVATGVLTQGTMYAFNPCPSGLPYAFVPAAGEATDMDGATSFGFYVGADDQYSSIRDIGFNFNYLGRNYTQFSVSTNGLIGFGSMPVTPEYYNAYFPSNGYGGSWFTTDFIAPYWEDLQVSSLEGSDIRYKVTGTAPNRVLTVEWKEMMWARDNDIIYTFQARLYETTNRIEYVYMEMPTVQTTSATIGISDNTNFISVTPEAVPFTSTSTANNDIDLSSSATVLTGGTMFVFDRTDPAINVQPVDVLHCADGDLVLAVSAYGQHLTYQWQRNGVDLTDGGSISGATTNTLTIAAATASDMGDYQCVVTGVCTATTSEAATFTVNEPIAFTTQPTSATICTGGSAAFSVVATGTSPTYQWQKDGVDLDGATAATLSITGATTADNGVYTCVVSNACGPVTSDAATLLVHAPPTIAVTLSPATLWPPNHNMVSITANVQTTGNCTPLTVVLVSLLSSEPDDAQGNGDGNTINDIQGATIGTNDVAFSLRAERAGSGNGRTYTATYRVTDAAGNYATTTATVFVPHDQDLGKPIIAETGSTMMLEQNVPNPFTGYTTLRFRLAEPGTVALKVYAIDGREVASLVNGPLTDGPHEAVWNGRDNNGRTLPAGVYMYRLIGFGQVQQQSMVLTR